MTSNGQRDEPLSPNTQLGKQLFHVIREGEETDDLDILSEQGGHGKVSPSSAESSSRSGNGNGNGTSSEKPVFSPSLSMDSTKPMLPELKAYEEHQAWAATKFTYELDGRPLPDIENPYYHPYHEPEPDHEPSPDFVGCWTTGDRFRAFVRRNHHYHLFIAVLIVIDIIIVIGELVVDLEIIRKNECRHSHDCPIVHVNTTAVGTDCYYDDHYTECIYKDGLRRCVEEHTHHDLDPAEVLHYMSIAILACFVLETLVRLIALGREFFVRKLELFDAVVVTVAFVLDLTIGHGAAVALLMFIRLWRVARIINGIAIAIESREAHIREHLKKDVHAKAVEVYRKTETIQLLKNELDEWKKASAEAPAHNLAEDELREEEDEIDEKEGGWRDADEKKASESGGEEAE